MAPASIGDGETPPIVWIGPSLLLVSLLACSDPEMIADCEPREGVTPICGFSNPEDLVLLPDERWLIASQGAPISLGTGGSLVAFRLADERIQHLYPPESGEARAAVLPRYVRGWGAVSCPGPPDPELFSPHGIDLARGDSGRQALAVVNHGGREAVELFAIATGDESPRLDWLGCVPMPPEVRANDVVLLPSGGFAITNMMPGGSGLTGLLTMLKFQLGADTGSILAWHEEEGWSEIPDSAGSGPNGIEVSGDGSQLYFTEWAGKRLVRLWLHRTGDGRRQSVDLPHHPDNLTWTREGLLLVAGQNGSLADIVACGGEAAGSCALPFSVLEIEPSDLTAKVVLEHGGQAAGAASVALQVGDQLYLGSFASDRLARAPYGR